QLGSEVGELLPALELGAIVERHDDELRRAIDAGPRRRTDAKRNERRHCGDESAGGQFSPPTEKDSDSLPVYPISRANLSASAGLTAAPSQNDSAWARKARL